MTNWKSLCRYGMVCLALGGITFPWMVFSSPGELQEVRGNAGSREMEVWARDLESTLDHLFGRCERLRGELQQVRKTIQEYEWAQDHPEEWNEILTPRIVQIKQELLELELARIGNDSDDLREEISLKSKQLKFLEDRRKDVVEVELLRAHEERLYETYSCAYNQLIEFRFILPSGLRTYIEEAHSEPAPAAEDGGQ